MPTASPSITASIGVVELMVARRAMSSMTAMVTPTPVTAVSSGSPEATREPSTSVSTTSATPRPAISVTLNLGSSMLKAWPPMSRVAPCGSRWAMRSATAVSCASCSLLGAPLTSIRIATMAARPSSETIPEIRSFHGEVAESTKSIASSSVMVSSMTPRKSSTRPPSGATKIAAAWVMAPCGKVIFSLSRATWEGEPGILNTSAKPPPKARAAPPTARTMTSHEARTSFACLKHQRPRA